MIHVIASSEPGSMVLTIEGHAEDTATCAAVTAFEQTAMIFFEQLAANQPDIKFTQLTPAMEATS